MVRLQGNYQEKKLHKKKYLNWLRSGGNHMNKETDEKEIKKSRFAFRFNLQSYELVLALVLIAVLFGMLTKGDFLSSCTFSNLFTQMTVISVLVFVLTFV